MKPEKETRPGYHPLDFDILERYDLRLARYKSPLGNDRDGGTVVYRIFPNERVVVFSGINDVGTSTTDASRKILESLMNKERSIDPSKFRFFDVQTIRGYNHLSKGIANITEVKFHENGKESLIPSIKQSELPEDFLPILSVLSNP